MNDGDSIDACVTCPSCKGEPQYVLGRNGIEQRVCSVCEGRGTISRERQRWIFDGRLLRETRQMAGLSMREAAMNKGVPFLRYVDAEQGRINPEEIE